MIFDVHTHAFPDFLAPKAMDALCASAGDMKPVRDGTLDSLLRSMDHASIGRAFLANIATRPEHFRTILKWSLEIASKRIVPLGSLHPSSPTWEVELEAICEAGLPGIKLHPQYQGFVVDSEAMLPIYRKAAGLGLFILFHAGYDIAFPGDESAAPRRLARVRAKVEDLIMVAAHFGGWQAWDEVERHLLGADIYLDTSYLHQLGRAQRERMLSGHSHERLLFASDSPWLSQLECVEFLRGLQLGSGSIAQILGENARSLHPTLH